MQPAITLNRTNIVLYCRRWQETVLFYREQLAFPVSFENDWFVEFVLTGDTYLSVADSRRASVRDVHGQGITFTWRVADLAAAQAQLTRRGIETTAIRRRWGALVLYCYDPEGHRLELWQEIGSEFPSSR
jgi:catechol 2,3-dioxygenase-like lactoylglutathione lyase family enzyme